MVIPVMSAPAPKPSASRSQPVNVIGLLFIRCGRGAVSGLFCLLPFCVQLLPCRTHPSIDNGAAVIQERLGHKNDEITKRIYLHVTAEQRKAIPNRFERIMSS